MESDSNEAYIKAVKCWLRKQDIDKQRNIQDIELTKEQMKLDDEVTRLAIISFNMWADENNAERIKPVNTMGEAEEIHTDTRGRETVHPKHNKLKTVYVDIETKGYESAKQQLRNLEATYDRILEKQERIRPISTNTKDHELLQRIDTNCDRIVKALGIRECRTIDIEIDGKVIAAIVDDCKRSTPLMLDSLYYQLGR